jgi:hypothetical protein
MLCASRWCVLVFIGKTQSFFHSPTLWDQQKCQTHRAFIREFRPFNWHNFIGQ